MSKDKPERLAIDGAGIRVAIIAARYNFIHVNALLESVLVTLDRAGVRAEDIETFRVPGSNETPMIADLLAQGGDFDVVIALGLIIRGETEHHSIIAHSTAHALQHVSITLGVPVINGIVCVENEAQAVERCSGKFERGAEFASAALEMARLAAQLSNRLGENEPNFDFDDLDWDEDLFDDLDPDADKPFR